MRSRPVLLPVPLLLFFLLILSLTAEAAGVRVVRLEGAVTPVTAEFLNASLAESAREGDRLFLVEMDTPGGLDSAMREIVKGLLASPVPTAVYVTPAGARAASAGAVIGLAADVLAMTPGTNIGAAHPVAVGEKSDKVMEQKAANDAAAYVEGLAARHGRNAEAARLMVTESRSYTAERALQEGLIDLIAVDRADLLKKLDGKTYLRNGKRQALHLAGEKVAVREMDFRSRVLSVISDPTIAYLLLMLGFLGIFFELSTPGAVVPGVIGAIAILLAFFGLSMLPVSAVGLLLIVLSFVFFIAEIKVVSHGLLAVAGVVSMLLGSLMLFNSAAGTGVSLGTVLTVTALAAFFCVFVVTKVIQAHRRKPVTGAEGLVGEVGRAVSDLSPQGKVFVRGEYWDALSEGSVAAGEQVVVTEVRGMTLIVKKTGIPQGGNS